MFHFWESHHLKDWKLALGVMVMSFSPIALQKNLSARLIPQVPLSQNLDLFAGCLTGLLLFVMGFKLVESSLKGVAYAKARDWIFACHITFVAFLHLGLTLTVFGLTALHLLMRYFSMESIYETVTLWVTLTAFSIAFLIGGALSARFLRMRKESQQEGDL